MFVKMYHGKDPHKPDETTYAAVFDGRVAPCSGDHHTTWGDHDGFKSLYAQMCDHYGHGFMYHMSVPIESEDAGKFLHTAELVWQGEV